jgi:cob(I)alamin adenosyltransferase
MNSSSTKILAFVGDGEGKTCAAIGHAVRAAGHGKKVAVLQFLKGNAETGEYKYLCRDALQGVSPQSTIEIHLLGDKTFVFDKTPKENHIKKAKEGLAAAKEMIASGKYFLIVLDEILDAVAAGLLPMGDLIKLIDIVGANGRLPLPSGTATHLILTGRILPPEISTKVDLITRMQKIKHYYDKGEKGIEGLDW